MKEPVQVTISGKKISIFQNMQENVPVVYVNLYTNCEQILLQKCNALGCKPFHLVCITQLRWEEELSPWAHAPVLSKGNRFTGEADSYVQCLTTEIIPYAENHLKQPASRILAGYSMGGLFALYAPYLTEAFSKLVAASGSVWYPGFLEFAETHDFLKNPTAIYLSLGNLESRTKNPYLSSTEICMENLHSIYQQKSIVSVFRSNPGNHYKDAPGRLAKGIAWALKEPSAAAPRAPIL